MPPVTQAHESTLKEFGIEEPLSPMQMAFVRHYAADPNLDHQEAARKAGYKNPTMVGCQLLGNPKIHKACCALIRRAMTAAVMTKQEVLEELSVTARRDLADYVRADNSLLPLCQMDPAKRRLINKYSSKTKVVTAEDGSEVRLTEERIETDSRLEALTLLMKHMQMLEPDVQVNEIILSHDRALIQQAKETMTDDAIREAATKDNPQQWLLARWLTGMLNRFPGGREAVREIVDACHRQAALAEAETP
jgi:phage terminase small subunit